jgi:hypothetical protein
MILMGNDSPYKVQEEIQKWESTHVQSHNQAFRKDHTNDLRSSSVEGNSVHTRRSLQHSSNNQ